MNSRVPGCKKIHANGRLKMAKMNLSLITIAAAMLALSAPAMAAKTQPWRTC
jgi:hypothetical protein